MPESELFLTMLRPLNRAGIRYMVGGSVAAIYYGEPRLTNDVDVVVFLTAEDIQKLPAAFPSAQFYVPPPEAIFAEVAREAHGHFNIIHIETGFKADLYPTGRDELNAWGFRRREAKRVGGETIQLAPPEYVIVRKLEFFREGGSDKHLRDIRAILNVSGDLLDRDALNDWITRRGVLAEWRKVQD